MVQVVYNVFLLIVQHKTTLIPIRVLEIVKVDANQEYHHPWRGRGTETGGG